MRGFARLTDVMMPTPSNASDPIAIHTGGAFIMYAARARAMMTITHPTNARLNQFTALLLTGGSAMEVPRTNEKARRLAASGL